MTRARVVRFECPFPCNALAVSYGTARRIGDVVVAMEEERDELLDLRPPAANDANRDVLVRCILGKEAQYTLDIVAIHRLDVRADEVHQVTVASERPSAARAAVSVLPNPAMLYTSSYMPRRVRTVRNAGLRPSLGCRYYDRRPLRRQVWRFLAAAGRQQGCRNQDRRQSRPATPGKPTCRLFITVRSLVGLERGRSSMNSAVKRIIVTGVVAVGAFGGTTSAAQDASSHAPYVARARSGTQGEVRVSAAALSDDESAAVYGSPLADKLIQPVWIEVENNEDVPYWMMFAGLDPNFFPASEAAEVMAAGGSSRKLEELDRRFKELAFRNPVPPGGMVAGFVLTNLHEGVKLLQIDLFADRRSRSFSFLAVVPGLRTDYSESRVFRRDIAADGGVVNYTDDPEFRAALEALPCCATNKDGSRNGDPLNLVIIGRIGAQRLCDDTSASSRPLHGRSPAS